MIGAIPNPTKKVTIEYPISQLKDAVVNIPKFYKKCRLDSQTPMFNQYTFSAAEFMSLGVFIDINLTSIADNRTEVNIELRRKLGAFDNWVEVQNANEHIQKVIDGLSKAIMNPNGSAQEAKEVKEEGSSVWSTIIGILVGIAILGWIFG